MKKNNSNGTGRAIREFIRTAKAYGLPAEQVVNFARGRYIPQPKQMEFHYWAREADKDTGPARIGFGGARGPGKSHASFAQLALDDCQRQPGLKALFLRSVGKAAKESFEDLIERVLFYMPYTYRSTSGTVEFPNGSRIILGGFRVEADIDKYIGLEYDVIVVEEATLLSRRKIDLLLGSLRTSKRGWRPRAYFTTNPGNVGHGDFKRMFINPMRSGTENYTKFIQANVYDNKFVDPGYLLYLEKLTGWMREAWLHGSWDIAAGTFFTNWDYRVHVIDNYRATGLPLGWEYWLSIDYGYNHWCVIYLMGRGVADGVYYVLDEIATRYELVPQICKRIDEMIEAYGPDARPLIRDFFGSPDLQAVRGGYTDSSIADQFAEQGYYIKSAVTDRINGAARILGLLGNPAENVPPRLFVTDVCTMLIEQLPNMIHDPSRPEDVLKVDADDKGQGGDDAYEAVRYGIMSYGGPAVGYVHNPSLADHRG